MVRVGIIGLGGMGNAHLGNYQSVEGAEVVAVADVDPEKLKAGESSMKINIGEGGGTIREGTKLYDSADKLIADPDVDLVDITLPTFLHAENMIKAIRAGKNVLCEKPMAMDYAECEEVLKAHEGSGVKLMIAQCIRFWPEYEYLKETVDSGRLGALKSLHMWRGGGLPAWSWDGWLQDHKRSGGAVLDLHVHDVDFVNHLLGTPSSVCSTGAVGGTGGYDVVDTVYIYEGRKMSVHTGANMALPREFGFEMKYAASFENGCLTYSSASSPTLTEITGGEKTHPEVPAASGYARELAYFVGCVEKGEEPARCLPQTSAISIKINRAEIQSIDTGKAVEV